MRRDRKHFLLENYAAELRFVSYIYLVAFGCAFWTLQNEGRLFISLFSWQHTKFKSLCVGKCIFSTKSIILSRRSCNWELSCLKLTSGNIYCDDFGDYWTCYSGTALYLQSSISCGNSGNGGRWRQSWPKRMVLTGRCKFIYQCMFGISWSRVTLCFNARISVSYGPRYRLKFMLIVTYLHITVTVINYLNSPLERHLEILNI